MKENLKSRLIELDAELTNVESDLDKARFMTKQTYIAATEPSSDEMKLYYYDQLEKGLSITLDYCVVLEKELESAREMFNDVFELCKKLQEGGVQA